MLQSPGFAGAPAFFSLLFAKEQQDVPFSATCKDVYLDVDHRPDRSDFGGLWWHKCPARSYNVRIGVACCIGIACCIGVARRIGVSRAVGITGSVSNYIRRSLSSAIADQRQSICCWV